MGAAASVDSVNVTNGFPRQSRQSSLNRRSAAANRLRRETQSPANSAVFKELVDTKFSFETAYAKVDTVMRELAKFSSARTDAITPALDFLFSYTSSKYGWDICQMWVEKLERNGLVPIMMNLWPSFWQPDLLQCASKDSGNGVQKDNITLENFWFVCRIIWNGSDCCTELCKSLVQNGTIEEMLKIIARKDFDPTGMKKDEVRSYITKAATGIVHNCLRHCNGQAKKRFLDANGVKILMPYMKQTDAPMLSLKATMVLAYVVSNEQPGALRDASDEMCKTIIRKLLEPALGKHSRKYQGFTLTDIMDALTYLAEMDSNKVVLAENGVLPSCAKVVENPENERELETTTRLIWSISFNPETKSTIQGVKGLEKALQPLREHSNAQIALAASGTLLNVHGNFDDLDGSMRKRRFSGPPANKRAMYGAIGNTNKNKSIDVAAAPGKIGAGAKSNATNSRRSSRDSADGRKKRTGEEHVMISYDHTHKLLVTEVNLALKQANYETWMDVDRTDMRTNVIEKATAAIRDAAAVLLCIGERYQQSLTCRAEAECAVRFEKPTYVLILEKDFQANGWLQDIIESADKHCHHHTPIKCTDNDDVTECVRKLTKQLHGRGKLRTLADSINGELPEKPKSKGSSRSSSGRQHSRHRSKEHKSSAGEQLKSVQADETPRAKSAERPKPKSRDVEPVVKSSSATAHNARNFRPPSSLAKQRALDDSISKDANPVPDRDHQQTSQLQDEDADLPPSTIQKGANVGDWLNSPVHEWSRDDVANWLALNELGHVRGQFDRFDGGLLLELRAMYHKSPNVFYQNARDDLGLTNLSDLLRLTQQLDKISVL